MSKVPKNNQKLRKKQNGYNFPERLPIGEVLKDVVTKKEWVLGPTIGKGGFGEIYSALEKNGKENSYSYAVKIEPHENGPLFMEKNLYKKIAKPEDVENWKIANNIKQLGMPLFYGSGSHSYNEMKYRFMIMEKFGKDLWTIFLSNGRKFTPATVYKIALQILDVLNYVHDQSYIHGDIKGQNLLLGVKKGTENNVFLVDFGMASKYTTKEFKADPKQAHNGTIEYTSCDMHRGVPTRRGDLEILGYNLLQWLNSSLPWEKDIKNKEKVFEKKKELMEKNVEEYMKKHFPNIPKVIVEFFKYVKGLKHDECPDYGVCRNLFIKELKKLGVSVSAKFDFLLSRKHKLTNSSSTSETAVAGGVEEGTYNDEEVPKKKKTPLKKKINNVRTSSPRKDIAKKTTVIQPFKDNCGTSKNNVSLESEEDIFFTPDEIKKPRSPSPAKGGTPKMKFKNKKALTANGKISWRDAPTVRAGTSKAGVYTKKTTNNAGGRKLRN